VLLGNLFFVIIELCFYFALIFFDGAIFLDAFSLVVEICHAYQCSLRDFTMLRPAKMAASPDFTPEDLQLYFHLFIFLHHALNLLITQRVHLEHFIFLPQHIQLICQIMLPSPLLQLQQLFEIDYLIL
jgi:hypothetical protein